MANTPVVILVGGKGTRLKPFTATFPKPLVPLGDKPILEIVLHQLANEGFNDVTLALGHLSPLIVAYMEQSPWIKEQFKLTYNIEQKPLGTSGALGSINGLGSTFLVMNGDILTNLSYRDLIDAHRTSGAALTIAAHCKHIKIDLGVLEANESGFLQDYIEKPQKDFEVSMGIYVYEPRALNFVERDTHLDFPDLVKRLIAAGERVYIHRSDAYWLDIGRPDDYAEAQRMVAENPQLFTLNKT